MERHAKTPHCDSLHAGRANAVRHAEGDLKDTETMKREHGRDVFEVAPTS